MKTLAIIGGGASGLAAAVTAGRTARGADVEVVLYEADERVGRSILASGNGRCNFSNAHLDVSRYRNSCFAASVLEGLQKRAALQVGVPGDSGLAPKGRSASDAASSPNAARKDPDAATWELTGFAGAPGSFAQPPDPVHQFFFDLGLCWREEDEGRLYPRANKASSVLDVLRTGAAEAGVRVSCGRRVVRIDAPQGGERLFHLRFSDGVVEHADAVVVAVGGRAVERLELPRGVTRIETTPVLGPLRTDTTAIRALNNIRVRCAVSLEDAKGEPKACEAGEVLFRDYGVSGIAVFNVSRHAKPGDVLCLDLFPGQPVRDLEVFFVARVRCMGGGGGAVTYERLLCGLLLPQVADAILRQAGLRRAEVASKGGLSRLVSVLKRLPLEVRGVGDAKQCQVTRGGLDVEGFDPQTMGSRALSGLFAAGEALDVDGPCGGYNLHWAWASGIAAGQGAIAYLMDRRDS